MQTKGSEQNRILKGNIIMAGLSFLALMLLQSVLPSIKIPLRIYNKIYSLLNFSTSHFDLAKLFSYLVLLAMGFAFVNIVNLKNYRKKPFIGNNGYSDIKKSVVLGFIIFLVSGNFLILGRYDYEGFCKANKDIQNTFDAPAVYFEKLNQKENQFSFTQNSGIQADNYNQDHNENKHITNNKAHKLGIFKKLIYNISIGVYSFSRHLGWILRLDFIFESYRGQCEYPVFFEIVLNNYFFIVLPFIIGLNFTYLDDLPALRDFNLTWHDMKNWGWLLWTLFILLCIFILSTMSFLFYCLSQNSFQRLGVYAGFLIALFIYIYVRSQKEKPKKTFHLHHYALMFLLSLLLGIHNEYFTILLGIFSGIMIEGCCRWGVSSCWDEE